MKRFLLFMLALIMVPSLSACGADASAASSVAVDGADTTEAATEIEVDYDLTEMSSEMVYALVYQMLTSPEDYMGKTIRMSGQYYAGYYNLTDQYYHYCIIADATSCCSQGMEFIWGQGEHSYPDEYPENYTEVVIVGTYGSYEELDVTYYCLLDSTLELQ